jgi:beta-1,2-mannosidase
MRELFPILYLLVIISSSCNNQKSKSKESEQESRNWELVPFLKADSLNPILIADSTSLFMDPISKKEIKWEEKDVFNPAAIVRNDTVFLLYRAEDKIGKFAGTSRIGLAWSVDGLNFHKRPSPVLFPGNDEQNKWEGEGGCEDPRIVKDEQGIYYLTYTAYDGDKARLMVAVSSDLVNWEKKGHAFQHALNGKYVNNWSKSGSIVSDYRDGSPTAIKISGKYWMYWGDTNIFLASSDDLINWTPVEINDSALKIVFGPRKGKFDSDLVEPGPAAMQTDNGILLLYNSRNIRSNGDTSLADATYAAAQILIDKNDPGKVIDRSENYFINPEKPYETTGQVNQVCFVEGLVQFKGKWFLYYGTADSKIAVAVKY